MNIQKPIIIGDLITNVIDSNTGLSATYTKVKYYKDGTVMSNSKTDGFIYRKLGADYYKKNISDYITTSDIGLIPNDQSEALNNYNKLIFILKRGFDIQVDDTYYLTSPYFSSVSENQIDVDIFLTGIDTTKSKLIINGGTLFSPKKNVTVSKLSIECPTNNPTYLFRFSDVFDSNFSFSGNKVTGNIRIANSAIPSSHDFGNRFTGFRKIQIADNVFSYIYVSSGSSIIFNIVDTPVSECYITGNNVQNFSYVFYSNAITNGHPSTGFIYASSKYTLIERNYVVNSEAYDPKVFNKNKHTYFCFSILESYECVCRDNVFEGFQIADAVDTVVYDNYFSVTLLTYESNTWKNIVNFTPNMAYVDLMKSKMGSEVEGKKLERYYRKNTYIIDPLVADRKGFDRFFLRKKINTYQEHVYKVVIEDNYFDMYILTFAYEAFSRMENYFFNRNTVFTASAIFIILSKFLLVVCHFYL